MVTYETTAEPITETIPIATGVRLRYRRIGTGEPLLLIMATTCSLGLWAPVEPLLSAGHHVISFDNRGLGGSERGQGPLSMASMAEDSAALLDALNVPRAHILGWSLGSAVAQELALRHPAKVGSLVLYGTWARVDRFGTALLVALRAPWVLGDFEMAMKASRIVFSPEFVNSEQFEASTQALLPLFPSTPEQMRVVVEQFDADLAHDTRDRLAAITAPTLILAGEQDLITPARAGRAVADATLGRSSSS